MCLLHSRGQGTALGVSFCYEKAVRIQQHSEICSGVCGMHCPFLPVAIAAVTRHAVRIFRVFVGYRQNSEFNATLRELIVNREGQGPALGRKAATQRQSRTALRRMATKISCRSDATYC